MRGDALRACLFSFDDSVKIVFDLTNAAPLTRRGTDILAVDNHESAEQKKRNSPAWANFVPLDGLTSEFVPFALGWYGDMGEAATSFIRTRIITRLFIYNSSYVFVVHRDRFFLSRFSHVAKYCNASRVFATQERLRL